MRLGGSALGVYTPVKQDQLLNYHDYSPSIDNEHRKNGLRKENLPELDSSVLASLVEKTTKVSDTSI